MPFVARYALKYSFIHPKSSRVVSNAVIPNRPAENERTWFQTSGSCQLSDIPSSARQYSSGPGLFYESILNPPKSLYHFLAVGSPSTSSKSG